MARPPLPAVSGKKSLHLTGNTGVFYVAYRLSKLGWNVLPTVRNARGPDLIIIDADGKQKYSVQVKTSGDDLFRPTIPFGSGPVAADFVVIVRAALTPGKGPRCYVLTASRAKQLVTQYPNRKTGKVSYWMRVEKVSKPLYAEKWATIGMPSFPVE